MRFPAPVAHRAHRTNSPPDAPFPTALRGLKPHRAARGKEASVAEQFYTAMLTLEKIVDRVVAGITGSLVGLVTILIFVQVIFRYVLQDSLSWSEELAKYMMVWIVFLSSGYVLSKGGHANIDFIINIVPPRWRRLLEQGTSCLLLFFSVLLIRHGLVLMEYGSLQKSSALQIPMSYVYLAIPIGGVLLAFYCVLIIVKRRGHTPC